MSTRPLVFIPNHPHLNMNTTELDSWGVITPIFRSSLFPDTVDEIQSYVRIAAEKLKDFDAQRDMLALIGDPALTTLLTAIIVDLGNRRFTVLKYDKYLNAYYPITISL